jgi:hypothetical protein
MLGAVAAPAVAASKCSYLYCFLFAEPFGSAKVKGAGILHVGSHKHQQEHVLADDGVLV